MLTDEILNTFDTNYKLLPPLREAEDIQALEGLIDGTIDGVTSDHNPMDIEHKKWNLIWPLMEASVWKLVLEH